MISATVAGRCGREELGRDASAMISPSPDFGGAADRKHGRDIDGPLTSLCRIPVSRQPFAGAADDADDAHVADAGSVIPPDTIGVGTA
jgi:hypothetical protein